MKAPCKDADSAPSLTRCALGAQDGNYHPLHWASYKSDHAECAQALAYLRCYLRRPRSPNPSPPR